MVRNTVIPVDKPSGPTSHDIVDLFRHKLGVRRVGHMGTLDPLATGLLLIGVGEATKLAPFLSNLDKSYICVAQLGARSPTYDAMGEIESVADPSGLSRRDVEEALAAFRGWIEQVPPSYSAVKVGGQPMYKYARKGRPVERKPRRVRVYEIELVRFEPPDLEIRMRVGGGTYVRSIVHDLGEKLGVGGYVGRLRRTAIGSFDVADAVRVTADGELEGDLETSGRSLAEALAHLRHLRVPEKAVEHVRNGGIAAADSLEFGPPAPVADSLYALVDEQGRLLAVSRCLISRGEARVQGGAAPRGELLLKPVRVFHDDG